MGVNTFPVAAAGDPAAKQVVFKSSSTLTLTTPMAPGLYELTTDTVQSTGTWQFNATGAVFVGYLRGGKGFVQWTSGTVTSITPPAGLTYPLILNIRLASANGPDATYQQVPIDYLIVAGGGGGGGTDNSDYAANGGGGGGGYLTGSGYLYASVVNTITIGGGGTAANTASSWTPTAGSNSSISDSIMGTLTAIGGGKGGMGYSGPSGRSNLAGGSGGGGSGGGNGGSPTSGQGFVGGDANSGYGGCGGGGASAKGVDIGASDPNDGRATAGGAGSTSTISSTSTTYAGGGGGGWSPYYGSWIAANNAGGAGGGGNGGGGGNNSNPNPGTGGLGGGGGAGGAKATTGTNRPGGAGGSGVVIIRYPDTYAAATSTTGTPTITVTGGYRIYKWTGSGSITI